MRKRIVSIQFETLPGSYFSVDGVREKMHTVRISRIIVDVENPPLPEDAQVYEEYVFFGDDPKDPSRLYYERELYKFDCIGNRSKWKIIPGGKIGNLTEPKVGAYDLI